MNDQDSCAAEVVALTGATALIPLSGGRTNHVWRSGDRVIKVFVANAASPLFPNSAGDEWTVLEALSGTGLTPRPLERFETRTGPGISYSHIEGETGWSDIADAARFLGHLHRARPPKGLPKAKASDVLDLGASMLPTGHWLADLKPSAPAQGDISLIHRDPVFTNFVRTPTGLKLVDWQCPAIGDPVEDIAHFLSPAMNLLYRGQLLDKEDIAAFLGAYPDRRMRTHYLKAGPAYHWRMACFAAWKISRGDAAYEAPLHAEAELLRRANLSLDRATVLAR